MLNIKTQLISVGTKRRSGRKLDKLLFFVDHDTGNPNSTAQNNVSYYIKSANNDSASAHIFIDDKEAIMCIPCLKDTIEKAWHVLYDRPIDNQIYGDDANDIAIGLELCYFHDVNRTLKAYNNYIEIAAYLAKIHGVSPSKRSGHFELDPGRKIDPNSALKVIGKTYSNMKSDIINKYNEMIKSDECKTVDEAINIWYKSNVISSYLDMQEEFKNKKLTPSRFQWLLVKSANFIKKTNYQYTDINKAIDAWKSVGIIGAAEDMKEEFKSGKLTPSRFEAFLKKSANFIK